MLIYSVGDAKMRQQVFAAPSLSSSPDTFFISPLARGLQHVDTLSALNLWRVQLVLPPSYASPSFRLKILRLTQGTLGPQYELDWLLGVPGSKRTRRLKKLSIDEVDFLSVPSSSAERVVSPLVTYFYALASPSSSDSSDFSALTTLREFRLTSRYPLGPAGSASHLLSGFISLETVELGGPGIGYDLFSSLFLPSPSHSCALPPGEEACAPASTLKKLVLTHLTHPSLPLRTLLSFLTPSSPSPLFLPPPPPTAVLPLQLQDSHFTTGFPHPRLMPWRTRRSLPELQWAPLAHPQRGSTEDELQVEGNAWEAFSDALRMSNKAKKRVRKDDTPVRLWKNGLEIYYAFPENWQIDDGASSVGSSNLSEDF
ncbi:hypothetical protein JCM8547_006952 [Rhodosporidiobolus lusitaniae]